jgi:hypothetical protein
MAPVAKMQRHDAHYLDIVVVQIKNFEGAQI